MISKTCVKYLTMERAVGQSIKTDTGPNRREIGPRPRDW